MKQPGSNRLPLPLILLFIVLTGFSLRAAAVDEAPAPLTGEVNWVYDGDTLDVAGIGRVRLLGIDVPERESSDRDRFFLNFGMAPARLRQIHDQALVYVVQAARGQRVLLLLDSETRDRHGRLLAYVVLPDGRMLNRVLLENGLAVVYRRFDFELKDDFLTAEGEARRKGLGLWAK